MKEGNCMGYFDDSTSRPIIHVAIFQKSKRKIRQVLLHEFAHFIQWKYGIMKRFEKFCDGWSIFDELITGKQKTQRELLFARNTILAIEYNAELITIELARQLDIKIGSYSTYYKAANSYVTLIKYSFYKKKFPWPAPYKNFSNVQLATKKLFAPITRQEIKIMER